ncbi:MAG TPA: ATP-binding protein [Gammaproteobacteria bacterium]
MKRTAAAVLVATAALGLLVSLALASRPMPVETHVAQYSASSDLQRASEDFRALVAALQSAWFATQTPGEGARTLAQRVTASIDRLPRALLQVPGSAAQRNRVTGTFETFTQAVSQADSLAQQLLAEQTAYAENVAYVRNSGAEIVNQMRDAGLDRAAADMFQLVIGVLDFARPDATVREFELRRLLTTLARDQRVDEAMPLEGRRLLAAAGAILNGKAPIQSKLDQLAQTPVVAAAANLTAAAQALYASAVQRVDQARMMLAVYAIVLFVAVGFVAFRLSSSYREINRANAELAELNASLEQRVAERTEELEGALADLKESQVQLVQAEKMSSLGQLVAGISHEINTPLLYLTNNAELIQERLALMQRFVARCIAAFSIRSEECRDRAEYQSRFVAALKEVKTMLRDEEIEANLLEAQDLAKDSIAGLGELSEMAQSLKDFSRLDRAPVSSFDVNTGLDKTLLIAKNIIKHKATVRKYYGDVPEIECSPSQINQVFLNIITNAAQAIEDKGEIIITTELYDDDHVAIKIADTGCGIPPENLSKIRDPFFTTKPVGSGTGLGLSIVDEIIRSHGGKLLIESEVGKGSVFTVVLPIKRPQQQGAERAAQPEQPFGDDPFFEEPLAEAV